MEELKLDVYLRSETGSPAAQKIRRQGMVPGIVYGGDKTPTTITFDQRAYERLMRAHQGQSVVVHLTVYDGDKKVRDYSTLVREEQHNPVTDALVHVDFNRISLTQEIEVTVPIESAGEAYGVKKEGGALDHNLWELDVICRAANIPEKLVVDVSNLKIGEAVHVKDLVLPEGVRTKHDLDAIVFSVVHAMREVSADAASEEAAPTEPEVLKEKKDKAQPEEKDKEKEKK